MKSATIEQKLQLIAKLSTSANHRSWEHDKLQVFLELPTEAFDSAVARLLNEWQLPLVGSVPPTASEPTLPQILETFTRKVKVNRKQTPQSALNANGRKQFVVQSVVNEMPTDGDEEVELVFSRVGVQISPDTHDRLLQSLGLVPDPLALNQANIDDPSLADAKPNASQWKDVNGKYCYIAFYRWRGGSRDVDVNRSGHGWDDHWWFAGSRKISAQS